MSRRSFSRKDRARIFALREGRCSICSGKIDGTVEAFEIEHEIPWEISRDDSDDNLQIVHVKCHKAKTRVDRKDIAKVHRMAAKNDGTWPKTRAKLQSRGFQSTRWHAVNPRQTFDESEIGD